MFLNSKGNSFRDTCHILWKQILSNRLIQKMVFHQFPFYQSEVSKKNEIEKSKTEQLNRVYPQNNRMIYIALGLIVLILWLDGVGFLSRPLRTEQQAILQGKQETYMEVVGIVTESKKGQPYCFAQLETGERIYLMFPYAHTEWYPTSTVLSIQGTVSLPTGQRNPGGFNQATWLKSKKTGLVLQADCIVIVQEAKGIWRMIADLHIKMEQLLYQYLSEGEANLAMALLTGAKHRLADDFYRMTQQMGIAHIFAVSGLHISVIGTVILYFFQRCGWTRSWIAFLLLLAGLCVYCMLAGLPASALRASGMILLSALAIRIYRPTNAISFLAFAAIALLLENPFLLWNAGFQLSFGVTASLLCFVSPIQNKLGWIPNDKLRSSISVVLAAWIGSVPLSAWHFYTITLLSPLYNFVLVPFVSIAVPALLIALCLSAVFPIGAWCFFLPAKIALLFLQQGSIWMYALFSTVQWNIGRPALWVMILYLILLIFLWYWLNASSSEWNTVLKVGIFVFSFIIVVTCIPTAPKEHQLLYLDVGQGSCALLRTTQGEVVLFDTGAQTQELASVIAWYGINSLDAVILSHGDTDHINGLQQVMERVRIQRIFMESKQMQRDTMTALLQLAEKRDALFYPVSNVKKISLQEFDIRLKVYQDNSRDGNQTQLIAMLQNQQQQKNEVVAFPGDLSLTGIRRLVAEEKQITLWTVPHHGSKYAGSAMLYHELKQKGAQYAVISAGKENRYGHPHQEVLQWIEKEKIPYYLTAEQGAILFYLH